VLVSGKTTRKTTVVTFSFKSIIEPILICPNANANANENEGTTVSKFKNCIFLMALNLWLEIYKKGCYRVH